MKPHADDIDDKTTKPAAPFDLKFVVKMWGENRAPYRGDFAEAEQALTDLEMLRQRLTGTARYGQFESLARQADTSEWSDAAIAGLFVPGLLHRAELCGVELDIPELVSEARRHLHAVEAIVQSAFPFVKARPPHRPRADTAWLAGVAQRLCADYDLSLPEFCRRFVAELTRDELVSVFGVRQSDETEQRAAATAKLLQRLRKSPGRKLRT